MSIEQMNPAQSARYYEKLEMAYGRKGNTAMAAAMKSRRLEALGLEEYDQEPGSAPHGSAPFSPEALAAVLRAPAAAPVPSEGELRTGWAVDSAAAKPATGWATTAALSEGEDRTGWAPPEAAYWKQDRPTERKHGAKNLVSLNKELEA